MSIFLTQNSIFRELQLEIDTKGPEKPMDYKRRFSKKICFTVKDTGELTSVRFDLNSDIFDAVVLWVVCWLIRRKAWIGIPGQP